jgi:hypothetical protein
MVISLREIIIYRLNQSKQIVGESVGDFDDLTDTELLDAYAMEIAMYSFELGQCSI